MGSTGGTASSETGSAPPAYPVKDPLSGHPGHLSIEQNHILGKFKDQLRAEGWYDPEKHDDAQLLRFLRARKFDLVKAKIMWIDTQKWKKDFKVDELYDTFDYREKGEVDKLYPRFYHKTDIDGRPIYVEQLGKLDLAKLYQVTTPERQMQSLVVEYERFQRDRLPICSKISGNLIETSCTIMDLKSVGISQFWKVKNYVQEAAAVSQNNYPESMGKFYIINAPWAFSTVWSLVKGWLDEATVAKIHILGTDYQTTLLQQVPPDSLPSFLGGACTCPEGCSMSDAGPWRGKKIEDVPGTAPSTSAAGGMATENDKKSAAIPAAAIPAALPVAAAAKTSTPTSNTVVKETKPAVPAATAPTSTLAPVPTAESVQTAVSTDHATAPLMTEKADLPAELRVGGPNGQSTVEEVTKGVGAISTQ